MRIHWLQHVPFEGLGCMEAWLAQNRHEISCTRLFAGERLPNAGTVDGLIVMGGPMGVYDEAVYPWLADEKALMKTVIEQNKPVLGVCLGAQLIAAVLGAPVTKNRYREIGFFPVTGDGAILPANFMAFHWHGDTFGLPAGAAHLAASAACGNQAFLYKTNVLALQFHLETTEESLRALYERCATEVTSGLFIQPLKEACGHLAALPECNRLMFGLLNRLF